MHRADREGSLLFSFFSLDMQLGCLTAEEWCNMFAILKK